MNVENGEPMVVNKRVSHSTPTIYFHKGKIYMAVEPNVRTTEENWKPLLIFDLVERKKELKGQFPTDIRTINYGQFNTSFFLSFNPDKEEFYLSWSFDEDLYRYQISTDSWDVMEFSSDYFKPPNPWNESDNIDEYKDYLSNNYWFKGLYYEPKTKRLHRLLFYPENVTSPFLSSHTIADGLTMTPLEKKILVFSINVENGEYDVIPFLNHLSRTFMFHPHYGALVWSQLNDAFDLDVQDFIVLAPVEIY
jgi:hypothetical protein